MTAKRPWARDNRSTTERGYGWKWQQLRASILKRDMHLCQLCKAKGRATPARAVDHIKPKAEGGTDSPSNLQAICDECHAIKTDAEAARAQGRKAAKRQAFDADGWPIWE